MFTVASRFRRLKFVGSYLSTIEAVGTGSWLSVVQVLLDVSIALLVAIIEFHGGIHRGYRTISSEFFFVKRYTQSDLKVALHVLLFAERSCVMNLFRVLNSTMAKGLPFPPPAPPSPCRAPVYYAPKCYVVSSPPPSRCCRPHSTSPQYRGPFTALL